MAGNELVHMMTHRISTGVSGTVVTVIKVSFRNET